MKLLFEGWRRYLNEQDEAPLADSDLIRQAFENTDPNHLAATLNTRTAGKGAAGSVFPQPTSLEDLVNASWSPHKHPAITSPAIGFKAPIPGVLGIAKITAPNIPDTVVFQPAHGGKAMTKEPNPETGEPEVLAEVVANIPEGAREHPKHTTLLIGPSRQDPDKLQVWTFFPGDPTPQLPEITLRHVQKKYNTEEERISGTKQDAIDMGYGFIKHANI